MKVCGVENFLGDFFGSENLIAEFCIREYRQNMVLEVYIRKHMVIRKAKSLISFIK